MFENTIKKYSVKYASKYLVLAIDLLVVAISFFIALSVLDGFRGYAITLQALIPQISVAVALYAGCSQLFRAHYGVIRHTSITDAKRVFLAITCSTLLLKVIDYNIKTGGLEFYYIPNSVLVLHYLISLTQLIAARFVFKFLVFDRRLNQNANNVLIFGAGSMGLIAKHTLEKDELSNLRIVGFLDDNESKVKKSIEGIDVYKGGNKLSELIKSKNIKEVIIAIRTLPASRKRELVDVCLANNVEIKTVPSIDNWINGELSSRQIKSVRIEDLLGRESIDLKNDNVQQELISRCILVTGAAGSIGSEIARQALTYAPTKLLLLDQSESGVYDIANELLQDRGLTEVISIIADVTQKDRLEKVFKEHKPDFVFHAAAYKHVPLMENNPFEAVECNVQGTINLADLSAQYLVEKFVMISTDKAVNPTNIMGATKRISEMYVQALNNHLETLGGKTHFITTRFGNVLGSNGSVIPLFKKQIEKGGPVLVTHPDITRYFMTIPEACQLVLEAGVMGSGGEIFIFDMGKSIKIIDLAKKMIQLSGLQLDKDIEIKFTGLRNGEKLYEELLNDQEYTKPTHHEKIMIAKVREVEFNGIKADVLELFKLIQEDDDIKLVTKMKKIVPEFISNASKYESLDAK
jgi:FlaA1/EpsC-like NDP-sugar epimerase